MPLDQIDAVLYNSPRQGEPRWKARSGSRRIFPFQDFSPGMEAEPNSHPATLYRRQPRHFNNLLTIANNMDNCERCKITIQDGDGKTLGSNVLCEDCYIDEVMPKRAKSHYDNDAEFMQRLKDSCPVRNQQYH